MRIVSYQTLIAATLFSLGGSATAFAGNGMPGGPCQHMGWGFGPGYHAAKVPGPIRRHLDRACHHGDSFYSQSVTQPSVLAAPGIDSANRLHGWPVPTMVHMEAPQNATGMALPPAPQPTLEPAETIKAAKHTPDESDLNDLPDIVAPQAVEGTWRERHPPKHLLRSALFPAPQMQD